MISFSRLGKSGRLGNQLFQYAFLRTQAEKLGVKFYCPRWIGDEIFNLGDRNTRASRPEGINNLYEEPLYKNYNRSSINLSDGTDIQGQFESDKNFDNFKAKRWYSFKKQEIARVAEKYKSIDFSNSTGIHYRFGDKAINPIYRNIYFIPRIEYFDKALKKLGSGGNVLVFSDDIEFAKKFLANLNRNFLFIEGNNNWEDLYLMTLCRDIICSPSTFSWWGAWLNSNPAKKIIFPKEGTFRPYSPIKNRDLVPEKWIKIRALIPIIDSYLIVAFPYYEIFFDSLFGKIGIFIRKASPLLYKILKPYFPDKK